MKNDSKKKLEAKLKEIEKKEEKLQKVKDKQKIEKFKKTYQSKYAGRYFETRNFGSISGHEIQFQTHTFESKEKMYSYIKLLPKVTDGWNAEILLYFFTNKTLCIRKCSLYDLPSVIKEINARGAMPFPSNDELDKVLGEHKKEAPSTDSEFVNWLYMDNNIQKYREAFIVREVEKSEVEDKVQKLMGKFGEYAK